ncbi:hypothetical protein BDY17DRAFT_306907 [Neohortaea acidophila]|uniref:Uncharacterized protein n=1 Tax=Neohortaea acidophila TaxID=245834 RepID=A0A6A6Q7B7_9PEZI|nr:uncharacterized protein BDY17DRAFT_306907 [Neohortaea acidophila]KAF2487533.1 hypothetical protein BDY17DRAFT_306907 [Neohortaea acidophila]
MPKTQTAKTSQQRASNAAPYKKTKSPKDSHLYTDDNPSTTIHGTGFKDKAAALRTLDLIKDRSLTYQFQTVNTMYHRAKHHPSMKKKVEGSAGLKDMDEAMAVFKHWLDVTYPEQKESLRRDGFKPLLSKECVERYLARIVGADLSDNARKFAEVYAKLPKGKRLANTLVDDKKPKEADWERLRYDCLDNLVPTDKESGAASWDSNELWSQDGQPTSQHLELIAWAWSPVSEAKLK